MDADEKENVCSAQTDVDNDNSSDCDVKNDRSEVECEKILVPNDPSEDQIPQEQETDDGKEEHQQFSNDETKDDHDEQTLLPQAESNIDESENIESDNLPPQDEENNTGVDEEIERTSVTESEEDQDSVTEEELKQYELEIQESIKNRIECLRDKLSTLRKSLIEEKMLWRKEIDELNGMHFHHLEHIHPIYETKLCDSSFCANTNTILGGLDTKSVGPVLEEETIDDYKKKLALYQGALRRVQAEKQQQRCRLLAAQQYKKKLLEVEKLCNMELARVRQSASSLVPLNNMVSEWNLPPAEPHKMPKLMSNDCFIQEASKIYSGHDVLSTSDSICKDLEFAHELHPTDRVGNFVFSGVMAHTSCPDFCEDPVAMAVRQVQSEAWDSTEKENDDVAFLKKTLIEEKHHITMCSTTGHSPRMAFTSTTDQ